MKYGGFHGHEIWQISPWNPPDSTMKSSGFHGFHDVKWAKDQWSYFWVLFLVSDVKISMTSNLREIRPDKKNFITLQFLYSIVTRLVIYIIKSKESC